MGLQRRLAPHDNKAKEQKRGSAWAERGEDNDKDDPFELRLDLSKDSDDTRVQSLAQGSVSETGNVLVTAGGISDRVKDFLENIDAKRSPIIKLADGAGVANVDGFESSRQLNDLSTGSKGIVQVRSSSGGYQPVRVYGVHRSTDDFKALRSHDYYRATPLLSAKTTIPQVSVSVDAPSLSDSLRSRVGLFFEDKCEEIEAD